MIVNLNALPKDLSGQEIKGQSLGKILSGVLSVESKGIDALKAYDWAVRLYNNEGIDIDRSDFNRLEKFISECDKITNIAKAQILIKMQEAS